MADQPTDSATSLLGHAGRPGRRSNPSRKRDTTPEGGAVPKGEAASKREATPGRAVARRRGARNGPRPPGDGSPASRPVHVSDSGSGGPEAGHVPTADRGPAARALRLFLRVLVVLVAFAVMVVFAAMLSRLTLEPSTAAERLTHTNLRPGESIRGYLDQPDRWDALRQLGGNIALGVPFGILLPVMIPSARGAVRITFCVALVMLAVELVQGTLVTGRAFDIDDVVLNATGALAGYLLLGRRLGRAVHPRSA